MLVAKVGLDKQAAWGTKAALSTKDVLGMVVAFSTEAGFYSMEKEVLRTAIKIIYV